MYLGEKREMNTDRRRQRGRAMKIEKRGESNDDKRETKRQNDENPSRIEFDELGEPQIGLLIC